MFGDVWRKGKEEGIGIRAECHVYERVLFKEKSERA